jgi:L-alanine-DL-glutamate epimerase-like enolase superfamily enzyme
MWAPEAALRFCARLPFAVAFIEEPCAPGELAGLPIRHRPAPIAAGEHCYGPDETAILDAANVEIWQPDAVFCGGFSALRAIAERAASRSRLLLPHGGGLLPALHAAAAGSVVDLIEYHLLLEPRRQVHWARSVLADANGMFEVPDEPGWAGPLRHDV